MSENAVKKFTAPEEDAMIAEAFQDVLNGYLRSKHRKKAEIIERAFRFAKSAHEGIRRRSGEPYILHPIAVAKIASQEIGLGSTSICAALLHDVVEDTDYTVDDIRQHFGPKIAQLVEGLTKISGGIFGDKASAQAENFRKLLLTMSEDIRVVLIKMADRLHNMRTLGSMAPNKQYKIAGETLYIYAPLAHRLGLFAIKTELEDLSFKYEHPAAYEEISRKIAETEARRQKVYNDFSAPITGKLCELGLKFEAKARVKSVYSIWKKMEAKHIPFEEVYDLYAMRIIFDCDDPSKEKSICWNIYSAITDIYKLHPDRTRDWISVPKANGYQALHLTVMGSDGNWVEIQIRSRRMDEIAEKGFAAHWKYKIGDSDEESELNVWLHTIKDILDNPEPNAIDFLDTLKLNLFASEIVLFTPKGELITLPKGATVLDVAFDLHSEIGSHCIAGKVNHKLVPLSYKLNSGDQVEVLTSQSQTPKPEWMDIMVTAKGKTSLRAALRKERQPAINHGKEIFSHFLAANGIPDNNVILTKVLGYFRIANREELYYQLGREEVLLDDDVAKMLKKFGKKQSSKKSIFRKLVSFGKDASTGAPETESESKEAVAPVNTKKTYRLVSDENGSNFRRAACCRPIPGDDALGFIADDGVVEVHDMTCERANTLKAGFGPRIVSVDWSGVSGSFPVHIHIEGIDRHGILQELISMISSHLGLDIRGMNIQAKGEVFECDLDVRVADASTVNSLCSRIKKIDGVQSAARIR
ncbi:MAG: RelA/SpoT family protein [Muribaculaceae bacterium]|nr:RelA/SpoT family protein [Muribaculaceae bacterium]